MNEFQVAYEKAKREANLKDESFKARQLLTGDTQAVLMVSVTRYCPYTDGIMGNDTTIVEVFQDLNLAEAALEAADEPEDDVVNHFLIRRQMPEELKSYNLVDGDDIPF